MLVAISPKLSVSSFMRYLKGNSTLMIFDRFSNLNIQLKENSINYCEKIITLIDTFFKIYTIFLKLTCILHNI